MQLSLKTFKKINKLLTELAEIRFFVKYIYVSVAEISTEVSMLNS